MDDTATLDLSNWSFDDWGDQDDRVKVFADDAPHTITGSAVADSLFGGDGSDRLDPGLGTDYVDAGAGFDEVDGGELRGDEDRLFGGTDTDLLSYEDERFDDARIDLEDGEAISSGLAPDKDQFAGFENLNDASGGNTLQGTDDANVIRGFEGNDTLDGRGGDDVLKGGAGDDRVLFDNNGTDGDSNHGGPGEDTIDGNGVTFGDATFDLGANEYDAGQYTETWQRFENYDNAGGSGAEEVIGAGGPNEITTGSGDNRLVGGGGQDDLSAGAGDDTLVGGVDGDRLDGGPGSDTASYRGSNAVQVNLGFDTARGGDAEGDTLHGIENLTGSPAADRLAGDSSANTLIGAGDPDTLIGGDDADRLVGGEGADDLDGGKGDDDLDGGPGGDTFFAMGGSDTLDYADSDAAVDVDLDREQASGGHAEGDTIAPTLDGRLGALDFEPAENILGSDHSDTLRGDARENRLKGGDGADTLKGHDGKDELIGGAGNDTIQGGATDADLRDRVFAGAGDDEADGGAGNDELRGDAGNDTLAGGQGADDVIGGADDDVMTGSGFSDLLFGGPGFDFVNGGFGYDRVNGGDGGDRFFHTGTEGHASDWIQDYDAGEGDVLQYGGNASPEDFQVNTTEKQDSGEAGVEEAFVIHRPSGQILWALVDGAGQDSIDLRIDGQTHDLLG
jgi:Ca2+-binding RTX toxin-like protein